MQEANALINDDEKYLKTSRAGVLNRLSFPLLLGCLLLHPLLLCRCFWSQVISRGGRSLGLFWGWPLHLVTKERKSRGRARSITSFTITPAATFRYWYEQCMMTQLVQRGTSRPAEGSLMNSTPLVSCQINFITVIQNSNMNFRGILRCMQSESEVIVMK